MTNRTSIAELGGMNDEMRIVPAGQYEQQATVLAAQAKAQTEARYVVAYRRPRDWDQVRQDILTECKRPTFAANKSAYYKKPIGDGVEGLGIRFAEVALRCMRNVLIETATVYEDDQKETVRVTITDLEANTTYYLDVRVTKTVERSKPMDDGSHLGVRTNSYGKKVYTVPASDDDLLNKRGALISKAIRTLALRIVPGDIQDEAERMILATREDKAAKDPAGERKSIADGFADIGVRAEQLVELLGHTLDQCSPAELVELRSYYGAIRDGETTFQNVVDFQSQRREEQAKAAAEVAARAADRAAKDDAKRKAAAEKTAAKGSGEAAKTPAQPETGKAPATGAPAAQATKAPAAPANAPAAAQAAPAPASDAVPGVTTGVQRELPAAGAPVLADALRAVNDGDDGLAHDIARTLGPAEQAKVAAAINDRDGTGMDSYE